VILSLQLSWLSGLCLKAMAETVTLGIGWLKLRLRLPYIWIVCVL
jgi:hypothetical protein